MHQTLIWKPCSSCGYISHGWIELLREPSVSIAMLILGYLVGLNAFFFTMVFYTIFRHSYDCIEINLYIFFKF